MSDETPATPTPPENEGAPAAQPERPRILTDLVEKPLEEQVVDALRSVFDPEIPVNIYDLGLIYDVEVDPENAHVHVRMTLTSPACPLTDQIEWEAQAVLGQLARSVTINWVWMSPWSIDLITDDGREQLQALGFMI